MNTETFLRFNGINSSSLGSLARDGYETLYNTAGIDTMKLASVDDQNIDDYYLERVGLSLYFKN